MIDLQNRIPVIVHNLKATQNLRLRDVVNWHRLVRELKGNGTPQSKLDLYLMLYDLLTGVCIAYESNPAHQPGVIYGPGWQPSGLTARRRTAAGAGRALPLELPTHKYAGSLRSECATKPRRPRRSWRRAAIGNQRARFGTR